MEENKIKDFDAFLRKAVKEVGLEEPSTNFNQAIFSKLELNKVSHIKNAKPLIPLVGWILIWISFIALVASVLFFGQGQKTDGLYINLLNKLVNLNFINKIPDFQVSEIYTYGVIGLLVFLYVQIFALKKYLNNKLAL